MHSPLNVKFAYLCNCCLPLYIVAPWMTLRHHGFSVVVFRHILLLLASNFWRNVKMANCYLFYILYRSSWSFPQSISIMWSLHVWRSVVRFTVGENKLKATNSAGKVMAGVFWDNEGILLRKFLKRGATVNSERYVRKLIKLKHRIRSFQPKRRMYYARILPTVPI